MKLIELKLKNNDLEYTEVENKDLEKFIKERTAQIDWTKNIVIFTTDYKDVYYMFLFFNTMGNQVCYYFENDPFYDYGFARFIHYLHDNSLTQFNIKI